jgi:hypothetical protein
MIMQKLEARATGQVETQGEGNAGVCRQVTSDLGELWWFLYELQCMLLHVAALQRCPARACADQSMLLPSWWLC